MSPPNDRNYATADQPRLTYDRFIEHMIRAFFSSRNIETVIQELLKAIVLGTDLDRAYVYEIVDDSYLTRTYQFCLEDLSEELCDANKIPLKEVDWYHENSGGNLRFVDDASKSYVWSKTGAVPGVLLSYIQAPFFIGDSLAGIIGFDNCHEKHHWSDEEKRIFNDLTVFLCELLTRKKMEQQISNSNTTMTTILDTLDSFIYVVEHGSHKLLFANASLRRQLRNEYSTEKACWELIRPDFDGICSYCNHDALFDEDGNPSKDVQRQDFFNDLTGLWLDMSSIPVDWIDGSKAVLVVCRDVTDRRKAEQSLLHKNKIHNFALSNAKGFTWEVNTDNDTIKVSPTVKESIGYHAESLNGSLDYFMRRIQHSDPSIMRLALKSYMNGSAVDYTVEHTLVAADGSLRWFLVKGKFLDNSKKTVCGVSIDITERKIFEERLAKRAYKDSLTGLYNMQYLTDNLLMPSKPLYHSLGAMILDIRSFKNINEAFGHEYGDQMLIRVVAELKRLAAGNPILRVSGDRFLIVFDDITIENIEIFAQTVLQIFSDPLMIGGHSIQVNFKIGIALSTENERNIVQLLKDAEIALYSAKKNEVSDYCLLNDVLRTTFGNKVNMELELQKAIRQKDFIMYFQPKISTHTKSVVGAEALIRWKHPEYGIILPLDFISLAEETGQIIQVGELVISEVVKQIRHWRDKGYDFFVSLNLSAKQFLWSGLTGTIKKWIEHYEIPSDRLAIEITESIMILDFTHVSAVLNDLRDFGIKVLLDDFGTGYSSMSYLGKMPIDNIKIDRSFLGNALTKEKGQAILNAIILLAHDLNLFVTAEGVETKDQLEMLENYGCDLIQGYLFSRPLPPDQFEKMIEDWSYTL